jgi:hypothetical protein
MCCDQCNDLFLALDVANDFFMVPQKHSTRLIYFAIINELHNAETFLRNCQSLSNLSIFQHFTEPESLLLLSEEPSSGLNPDPDESGPYCPTLFI